MCSLTTECVLLLQNVFPGYATQQVNQVLGRASLSPLTTLVNSPAFHSPGRGTPRADRVTRHSQSTSALGDVWHGQ